MTQTIAGRYDLAQQIGHGGMGSVWRAWDRKHDRWVAVKVLGQTDASMLLRFVREQSLRIQHPHVVAPLGWAADDDCVALSMDLVRGGSVETLLGDHGPLPEAYVAVLLDQMLDAVEAIHRHGVVHRDITPANLLLEPTGSARPVLRVGDFGIAAVLDEPRMTRTDQRIGTLGYCSPEQAAGAEPDPRQDLYSIGIVGLSMLTGLPPRALPTTQDGLLAGWLMRLSSPDAVDRPASAAAARQELRALSVVPDDAPWAEIDDPPTVFEQVPITDPPPTPRTVADTPDPRTNGEPETKATTRHTPPDTSGGPSPVSLSRPGRSALTVVMTASFALAAALLVVLLIVLL